MRHRVVEPEVMDDPALDAAAHRQALAGLSRLNMIGRAAHGIFRSMRDLLSPDDPPRRALDIATGGGDVAIALCRLARRAGLKIEVHGCDLSPVAIEFACQRAERAGAGEPQVRFFQLDALSGDLPGGYDIVTCSLFLHHLPRPSAVALLMKMSRAAGRRVIVSDLDRRSFHFPMVWLASRLVTRSPVVHTDAMRSIRAAFTVPEARELAAEAGLAGARVSRCAPCRWLLTWNAPGDRRVGDGDGFVAASDRPV